MSIFGVKTNATKDKLPTINQFVKSTKKSEYQSDGVVELVWLPGKFRNYTLQTDSFRIIIPAVHELFKPLGEFVDSINPNTPGIRITVSNWKSAEFVLSELPEHNGCWEYFGRNGIRWTE